VCAPTQRQEYVKKRRHNIRVKKTTATEKESKSYAQRFTNRFTFIAFALLFGTQTHTHTHACVCLVGIYTGSKQAVAAFCHMLLLTTTPSHSHTVHPAAVAVFVSPTHNFPAILYLYQIFLLPSLPLSLLRSSPPPPPAPILLIQLLRHICKLR
jgi:hypothetical protein